ncbi:hypothetical protein HDZ31DRAFT_62065 [Schizophyllum fasciatum]
MGRLSHEDRALLEDLIRENGIGTLEEYISHRAQPTHVPQTFTPTVIRIRRIAPENAHEWIDLAAFAAWLVGACQQRLREPTPPEGGQAPAAGARHPPSPPPSVRGDPPREGQRRPAAGAGAGAGGQPGPKRPRLTGGDPQAGAPRDPENSAPRDSEAGAPRDSEAGAPRSHTRPRQCAHCAEYDCPCVPQSKTPRARACQRCAAARISCSFVAAHRGRRRRAGLSEASGGRTEARQGVDSSFTGATADVSSSVVASSCTNAFVGSSNGAVASSSTAAIASSSTAAVASSSAAHRHTTHRPAPAPAPAPKPVSSGPWQSAHPGAARKVRINGKQVDICF